MPVSDSGGNVIPKSNKSSFHSSRLYYYLFAGAIAISLHYAILYRWYMPRNNANKDEMQEIAIPAMVHLPKEIEENVMASRNDNDNATIECYNSTTMTTEIASTPMTNTSTWSPVSNSTQKHHIPWTPDHHPPPFERFLHFPTAEELQSACPPRLEFLHIPKCGGTTIERSAFQQANIAWGCCHFHLNYGKKPWNLCPLHLETLTPLSHWPPHKVLMDLWHYPLHWLQRNRTLAAHPMPSNPYHNLAASTHHPTNRTCPSPQHQELHFFAVVRDPYTRAISEFYYKAGFTFAKDPRHLQNPKIMNHWIRKRVKEYQSRRDDPTLGWNGRSLHWIPQSEYIFDSHGHRQVHHVLRFENLTAEFQDLVQRYHLPLSLRDSHDKSGPIPAASRLGPQNLTKDVRTALELHFAKDFVLGNYPLYRP